MQQQAQTDAALKQMTAQMDAQVARYKAELAAQTQIEVARIREQYASMREAMQPQQFNGNQQ
jgi:hypothetical protein